MYTGAGKGTCLVAGSLGASHPNIRKQLGILGKYSELQYIYIVFTLSFHLVELEFS